MVRPQVLWQKCDPYPVYVQFYVHTRPWLGSDPIVGTLQRAREGGQIELGQPNYSIENPTRET